MINNFYMHRIKRSNGVFDKGIEVKETYADAKQAYHAYLGAWAYGHDADTDFVQCLITDSSNASPLMSETWIADFVQCLITDSSNASPLMGETWIADVHPEE